MVHSFGTSQFHSFLFFVFLLTGKDARREHIATGEQLHLTDVREGNAGVYECVADPHNDLAISHTFTVTVNGGYN